jgi:hypothetical protein
VVTAGPGQEPPPEGPRLIKRYANRKLYDTGERRFTSLGAIRTLVRKGVEVVVVDHATGEDRTAETLGQTLGQRRGTSGAKGLGLSVLEELIRAPERLDRALSGEESDAGELRELRDEVRALSRVIDGLLSRAESIELAEAEQVEAEQAGPSGRTEGGEHTATTGSADEPDQESR